jgi:hypothetical protein
VPERQQLVLAVLHGIVEIEPLEDSKRVATGYAGDGVSAPRRWIWRISSSTARKASTSSGSKWPPRSATMSRRASP